MIETPYLNLFCGNGESSIHTRRDSISAKIVPQGVASRVLMNRTEQELAEAVGSLRETEEEEWIRRGRWEGLEGEEGGKSVLEM